MGSINFFNLISAVILVGCFLYAAPKILKKGRPMYFQIIVLAVGCFALEEIALVVADVCNTVYSDFSVREYGILGCNLFLLAANYGLWDNIVDDGDARNVSARKIAMIAPIVLIAGSIIIVYLWSSKNLFVGILWLVAMLPAFPASYFNLKHVIMPPDDYGLLINTKWLNIAALAFYAINIIAIISLAVGTELMNDVMVVTKALVAAAMIISALKGEQKWATRV